MRGDRTNYGKGEDMLRLTLRISPEERERVDAFIYDHWFNEGNQQGPKLSRQDAVKKMLLEYAR